MGLIQVLPSLIAERIAAGEVIERPASVVKELAENSIDAGATHIEVRLLRGGTDLIEIIDNGHGMPKEDLELCICRHATSKIKLFEDLSALHTLGFRGEALPSIASVSDLAIASRAKDALETFEVRVAQTSTTQTHASRIANLNFLGSDHGTRIKVASLFSQVPARLKFLKSPGAEASATREILERLALTHPEIHFKLSSDDRVLLDLPIENLKDRAVRMLAENNPYEVKEVTLPGSYGIQIIWLKGLSFPHTRSMYQIVNGRALRDRTLQMAILNPLKQSFLPGNFPAIVVKLSVPTDEIDVNVHPTKTEIRFLDSGKIFALCNAALSKLTQGQEAPSGAYGFSAQPASGFSPKFSSGFSSGFSPGFSPSFSGATGYFQNPHPDFGQTWSTQGQANATISTASSHFGDSTPFGEYRGVLFSTYFVFEHGDELLLIDQHAAHERIRYERLKKSILNREKIDTQALLVPEVVKLQETKLQELKPKLLYLESLGFEVEIFGEDSLVFRSIPAVWGNQSLLTRLKNLVERLIETDTPTRELAWDETLFEKIAMEACRSSFKAGDRVFEESAIDLTEKLFQCEHPGNCPHGRPTSIKISKSKVEEWFSRLS